MQRTKEKKRDVVQSQREEERRSSARCAVRWGEERGEGGGGGGREEAPVPRAPDRREVTPTELSDHDIIVVVDLPYPHRVIAACAFCCVRLRVEDQEAAEWTRFGPQTNYVSGSTVNADKLR